MGTPVLTMSATWSTGLCSCCAQPGGFLGGCLGSALGGWSCFMCFDAPQVAEKSGFEESGCKAFCCSVCPFTAPCYMMQVYRECAIQQGQNIGKPMQNEMQ